MDEVTLTAYANEIRTLNQTGRSDEAITLGRHILRYYPKDIATYEQMAEAALERGDLDNALELFRRVLSADPESAVAYIGLAIVLEKQNLTEEAVWHLERAFELAPDDQEVRKELQRLYAEVGSATPRIKLTPGALARLYAQQGLYERAIHEYRFLLNTSPNRYDLSTALIEATWHMGRMREAADLAQQLIEKLPYSLKANLVLGTALQESGVAEGESYLQNAQALDPTNHVAREMLGTRSPLAPTDPALPRYVPGAEPPLPAAAPAEETPATDWFAETKTEAAGTGDIDLSQPASREKTPLELAREFFESEEADIEISSSAPGEAGPQAADSSADWSAEFAPASQEPTVSTSEADRVELASDLPPWLRDTFAAETPTPAETQPAPLAEQPVAETPSVAPDWLSEAAPPASEVQLESPELQVAGEPAGAIQESAPLAPEIAPAQSQPEQAELQVISEVVAAPETALTAELAETEPRVASEPESVQAQEPAASALPELEPLTLEPLVEPAQAVVGEIVAPSSAALAAAPTEPAPSETVETPTVSSEPPPVTGATLETRETEIGPVAAQEQTEQVEPEPSPVETVTPVKTAEPTAESAEIPSAQVALDGKPTTRPEEMPDVYLVESGESAREVLARSDAEAAQTLERAAESLHGPSLAWAATPGAEPNALVTDREQPRIAPPGPTAAAAHRQRTLKAAERLEQARFLRDDNRMNEALVEYEHIIQHAPRLVPQVIPDLEEITTRPDAPVQAHRILGDAYTRVARLSDALERYRFVLEQPQPSAG